jgi:hypothetical protein
MADHSILKQPDIHAKDSDNGLDRTTSITSDAKGNTVITREDGETFTIDHKAERALVWKFDLRILPLLALMYLFNALDKSNLGNAATVCSKSHLSVLRDTDHAFATRLGC